VVALTVHITTLKGNARTLVNLQEKKIANFDAFLAPMGQAGRSPLWVRIFFPEFLFYY
jgi:hypothetical protein